MSKRALERCIDEAVVTFQAAESAPARTAGREELADARTQLLKLRPTWGDQYASALRASFARAPADAAGRSSFGGSASSFAALGGSSTDFASLTLVDDDQLSQGIEFARLSQQLQAQVDGVMADFDALISSAMGLPNVRPELNPLRPEVFAQALRDLIDAAGAESTTQGLWLKHLTRPVGKELLGIYQQLITLLEQANVQAASYRVMPVAGGGRGGPGSGRRPSEMGALGDASAPGGAARRAGGGDGASGHAPMGEAPEYFADPSQAGGEDLVRDFLRHGGANRQARLAESYYARVDEELEALRAAPQPPSDSQQGALREDPYAALPAVDRPARRVDAQGSLSSRVWGAYAHSNARKLVRAELKKEATHVDQVLGLEVVRQLVNQVAQDPRLLAPVREAIVALEPSLLRLAMVDPRFFSEENHPGRLLMEHVAQRSFKYNDEYSAEFITFFESVSASFNALNSLKIDNAQPFSDALVELDATWAGWDREEEARRQEMLAQMRFAEERQALADQIAFDLSARPDLEKVPGAVLDFLFGPWSLVMAHARLQDQGHHIDPGGYGVLVSDLVWSVKRDFTLRHPAKLMEMIPGMVRKLNAGLDLIALDTAQRDPFFDILMRLHSPVLKLRRLKSARDHHESGAMPLEPDLLPATPEQRVPKAAAQPWLASREQDEAGFEELPPPAAPASAGGGAPSSMAPQSGGQARADGSAHIEEVMDGLQTGRWVDLFSRQQWLRAQLVWASTKGTLFMFVSHGGRPHSMTKRSCERLIGNHQLRLVDSHAVVAQALASLQQDGEAAHQAPAHAGH